MRQELSRRRFLSDSALAVAGAALFASPACNGYARDEARAVPTAPTPEADDMRARFQTWLQTVGMSREPAVRNLVWNFWDTEKKRGNWIYPMLSGKAILWFIKRGLVPNAVAIANTLLTWQQTTSSGALARSFGAFPSVIEVKNGKWRAGDRYYSGDNLVILQAFLTLHRRTRDAEYLNAAIGIGTWLTTVMCKGHEFDVWAEDHGAPMWFVTSAGDFGNDIQLNVEALWIGALAQLGKITGDGAYTRQVDKAREFYRLGQHPNGAFFDHYAPEFPAKPYSKERWLPYQENQVISDNVLRAALGACRAGDLDAARKFFRWLKSDRGAFPAYLNLSTGEHGFSSEREVYYDVTSSGLHRSLCHWLDEHTAAQQDIAFLRRTQTKSGAWYWGLKKAGLRPVRPELGAIVGLWATADLSTLGSF